MTFFVLAGAIAWIVVCLAVLYYGVRHIVWCDRMKRLERGLRSVKSPVILTVQTPRPAKKLESKMDKTKTLW